MVKPMLHTNVKLGDIVKYVRVKNDPAKKPEECFKEGEAYMKGFSLDGTRRPLALLEDVDGAFNTPLACVNPSPEMVATFKAMVLRVNEITTLANREIKQVEQSAIKRISEEEDLVLGKPLAPFFEPAKGS